MDVTLSNVKDEFANTYFWLFKPDGAKKYLSHGLTSNDGEAVEKIFYNLTPGVYELDVEGSYENGKPSNYNLSVKFSGIKRLGNEILDSANQKINVINLYNNNETYKLSGKILGYENSLDIELNGKDTCSIPFDLRRDESSKEFTTKLSKNDYEKITDFSLIILDDKGISKEKNFLSYREGNIVIENTFNTDSVNLRLMLIPAFAFKPASMTIHVNEQTVFNNPESFTVEDNNGHTTTLYPDIEKTLDCNFSEPYQFIPRDATPFGKIYFETELLNRIKYEIPVYFNF